MADLGVPHFQNEVGVPVIEVGAKEFMCIGARPPFDHPHIFCDMGQDHEIICEYCSTLYRYNPALGRFRVPPGRLRLDRPAGRLTPPGRGGILANHPDRRCRNRRVDRGADAGPLRLPRGGCRTG